MQSHADDEAASPSLPPEFQRIVESAQAGPQEKVKIDLEALLFLGITSYERLAEILPTLRDEPLVSALWALPYFDKRKTVPLVQRLLKSHDPQLRKRGLDGLWRIGGRRANGVLARHLLADPDPGVRESAAYGLGAQFDPRTDEAAFKPLLAALENQAELPNVRAQTAESLGNIIGRSDRRARPYRQAQRALTLALEDTAPEVRFWAAFALGEMRSRAALPKLRELASTDAAICPRWWAIKDEAADAIECILTGSWPDIERQRQR